MAISDWEACDKCLRRLPSTTMAGTAFTADPSSTVYQRIVEFAYSINLSTREAMVLILTAGAGVHRKEAAHLLGCSAGTVDTYWRRILRKSKLGSQLELLAALLSYSVQDSLLVPLPEPPRGAGGMAVYRASIDEAFRSNLAAPGRAVGPGDEEPEPLAMFEDACEGKRTSPLRPIS